MTDTTPEPAPVKPRPADKDRAKALRGQRAEKLLANPLLTEAFDKVEKKLDEGWKKLDGTPETRERAYLMHRLLVQLRKEFEIVIRDGKSAAKLLDLEEQNIARRTSSTPERQRRT